MRGVANARKVFDEMPLKSLVLWTGMVTAYVKCGEVGKARALFDEMVERDVLCWNVKYGKAMEVLSLFRRILGEKMSHPDEVTYCFALIDMYGKCGSLGDARVVFDKLKNKDVIAYNSMITCYAMHGQCQEALQLFAKKLCSFLAICVGCIQHLQAFPLLEF
ncbi:pentatricopeptide repeat-containing protein ELI1, chloroplastic [Tanacetum coccineum]